MENFDFKKYLAEGKLLKEETNMIDQVKDFFLNVSNNQKSKVQKYDWHTYLNKSNPQYTKVAGVDYPDEPGGLHNSLIDDPNYQQWKDLYNSVDDFMNKEEAGKEIKLSNGAILFLVPRNDQYGGESMVPEEFIIRK
jgi:hypothetical protein